MSGLQEFGTAEPKKNVRIAGIRDRRTKKMPGFQKFWGGQALKVPEFLERGAVRPGKCPGNMDFEPPEPKKCPSPRNFGQPGRKSA